MFAIGTSIPNLLKWSDKFDESVWYKAYITVEQGGSYNAAGNGDAYKLVCDGTFDPIFAQSYNTGSPLASRTFIESFVAWTDAGQPTESTLYMYDAGVGDVGSKVITLETYPKRFFLSHTFGSGETDTLVTARIDPVNSPAAGNYLYIDQGIIVESNMLDIPYSKTTSAVNTTEDYIILQPTLGYKIKDDIINSQLRTHDASSYNYKWGEFEKISVPLEYISESDRDYLNDAWANQTELVFYDSFASRYLNVKIVNKTVPIYLTMKPYDDQYKGKLDLETYE